MSVIESAILGVVVALFLALGITVYVQHRHIASDQTRIEHILTDKAAFQAENNNWKLAVRNQNQKIAALVAAGAVRRSKAIHVLRATQKKFASDKKLAAAILAQHVTDDDCPSAVAIKDFYLRNKK